MQNLKEKGWGFFLKWSLISIMGGESERENTSVKRESKWWLVIVACSLNNTLRACLRWSLIPPRMGLIPLSWGLIPISPRMGPDSIHIAPHSTLYGPDSTRIEAGFHLTWGPIPPCVGLILVKLSVEGFLLIIKAKLQVFFGFPFLPCYLAGV
jgi:hypothetical protein